MSQRALLGCGCLLLLGLLAWLVSDRPTKPTAAPEPGWRVVHESPKFKVHRSATLPAAYLIEADGRGLLLGCPEGLTETPVPVDRVLLHHHHRDAVGGVQKFLDAGVPVSAPEESLEYLERDKVTKYWKESIPQRDSRKGYFVHPTGFVGIQALPTTTFNLEPTVDAVRVYRLLKWEGLEFEVHKAPGVSRDHVGFQLDNLLFVGDALTGSGYLPRPYTTDWDHWTDVGLKPAAETLRELAAIPFTKAFPGRGPVITSPQIITDLAAKVEEAAFLKSFERFTNRMGDPP